MKRLVLFAHFDRDNRIRPYILHHLQALKDMGTTICFISNSELSEADRATLGALADHILLHENVGYDFAMWQAGWPLFSPGAWDEVILTNSSIIGPLAPLEPLFERMACRDVDFWGMTESRQFEPHLQSYFLVFRRSVLESGHLTQFFSSVLPYRNKRHVIFSYELGLTAFLQDQGFRGEAAFPIDSRSERSSWKVLWGLRSISRLSVPKWKKPLSPTIDHAMSLLLVGMPYLKTEIITRNPRGVWHYTLRRLIAKSELISHLCSDV